MSSEDTPSDEIREPKPGRLVLIGLCVLIAAGAVVVSGIRGRAKTQEELAGWTKEQALPSVELVQPQRGSGAQELVLPGNIDAFSTAPIYARASGYVKAWYKDIGAQVKKGEILADIDTPDLDQQYAQAKADLANAQANANLAAATAKRYHTLVDRSIISQQTDDEKMSDANSKQAALESSKANLARIQALVAFKSLTAPFDGVITTRSIDVGTLLTAGGTAGNALFQISDLHEMRIYVRVPQAFVAELRPGQKASLKLRQYPGQEFDATLVTTSNSITQESRTALVQLQADNPDGKLWPGTYAEVHFHLDADPNVLHIPATALIFGEKGIRVAILDADDQIVFKTVQLGHDIGTDVEILTGIASSDRLVNSPLETLNAGDKVLVASKPGSAPAVVEADEKSRTN